jgi:predicted ATPase
LADDAWAAAYSLAFFINMQLAECEYLCGSFERAEALFDDVLAHAATDFDRAAVYELQLELYELASKFDVAVTIGLRALALFGVTIPEDDDELQAATQREAQAVAINRASRAIAELAHAPAATDPRVKAVLGLLSHVAPAAHAGTTPQKYPLINLLLVNWSLR